ncbi:sel1 repeat family protein [Burkholderiaceae bacterium]|nr:sel1 repeat family protein [Burkholderiaceae bacterium]
MVQTMKKLLTALTFSLAATVWAGDFEAGVAAYERRDFKMAFTFFQKAADQGDVVAQYNIATMYELGEGVSRNTVEANRIFKIAAERGNMFAQFHLALNYRLGVGGARDRVEAARLLKLAAAQGHPRSQFYTAEGHYFGDDGLLQSYVEAVRWYKLAAVQGDSQAQGKLARMYQKGEGVLQDFLLGHMWANLAFAAGNEAARETRIIVAREMSPQQVAKAQAMAKRCLASNYKDCN